MPQLIPFFFINQVLFVFTSLSILIYVNSRYFLPTHPELYNARIFLTN